MPLSRTHSIHHLTTQWNSGLVSVFNFSHAKFWLIETSPAVVERNKRFFYCLVLENGGHRFHEVTWWTLFHLRSTFFPGHNALSMSTVFPFVLIIKPEPNQRIFLGMCSQGKFSKCFWCLKILFSYANCIFSIW